MPSTVLNFKTPMQMFLEHNPNIKLVSDLPIKICGCTVFIQNYDKNKSKLDPKPKKCIFLGYSSSHKGYKCFDPAQKN